MRVVWNLFLAGVILLFLRNTHAIYNGFENLANLWRWVAARPLCPSFLHTLWAAAPSPWTWPAAKDARLRSCLAC